MPIPTIASFGPETLSGIAAEFLPNLNMAHSTGWYDAHAPDLVRTLIS
jgi:hypothetical protein